jgi:hypothetical protein
MDKYLIKSLFSLREQDFLVLLTGKVLLSFKLNKQVTDKVPCRV